MSVPAAILLARGRIRGEDQLTHTPTQIAVPPAPEPRRQRAWADALGRLRAAAVTEPGRLRIIGALLALLVVAFGAVTAWQIADRSAAADDVVNRSEPLSAQAADIYRSLADADTTAAGGFLAGGQEPRAVRQRYENDIALASRNIADAAAKTSGSDEARAQIELLNIQLPVYTGLVETARANNKQGLPLGGAYLRYANGQMTDKILPAAKKLWDIETARLQEDYGRAKALPWAAWGLGVVALGGLVWAQHRSYRRTNRVFNQGLLAGSAATAVVLLWLVAGHSVARFQLDTSYSQGAKSLQLLNQARIESLQSRGDENLTLVARGAGADYNDEFRSGMQSLAGTNADGRTGLLAQALALANDAKGRESVKTAMTDAQAWWALNGKARASDDSGNYQDAVAQTIGGEFKSGKQAKEYTGICFDGVDASLRTAVAHEQAEFRRAANDGRGALAGLGAGAALLAVLGAAGAVLGVGRRLSEYR
jgi:hypothetical protein